MLEICEKLRHIPFSDNTIDYVEEKLESMENNKKYVKLLEELYSLGIELFKGKGLLEIPADDINRWDREYDALCKRILNSRDKIWICSHCGRKFSGIYLHNCKGTVRKRGLSFYNKETHLNSLMYPGELYLYDSYYPIVVERSRLEDILAIDGKYYNKNDISPIKIEVKNGHYKFGRYKFIFKYGMMLVLKNNIPVHNSKCPNIPRYFHQLQRLYPPVLRWQEL